MAQQGIEPDESRWIEVDSSCIEAVRFDRLKSSLFVHFHSQSVYLYKNFHPRLFEEFVDSSSKGQFFHQQIRDRFPYRQIP